MRSTRFIPRLFACLTMLPPAASIAAAPSWSAAFRYRMEQVEQAGFDRGAFAATARLRLGATLPLGASWRAFAEGEAVWAIADSYDSGANGRTGRPVIGDPAVLELNQGGIAWRRDALEAIAGRQRIAFDNQRFVGNVGWRQNEQTFDAVMASFAPGEHVTLHYARLDRVHRVAGDRARDPLARERDLDAHLLHAALATDLGTISAYDYAIEDRNVASASTRTRGVRWTPGGKFGAWRWTAALEAAQQHAYARNPLAFSHGYRLVEGSAGASTWSARLGFERLSGNGVHALQTPLATLHAFNGWADVFVLTPARGLEDRYAGVSGSWTPPASTSLDWTVMRHDYDPVQSGERYGSEWNASVGRKFAGGWSALLKFADYRRDGFGRDVRKLWLQFEWSR